MMRGIGGPGLRGHPVAWSCVLVLLSVGVALAACRDVTPTRPPTAPGDARASASVAASDSVVDYELSVEKLIGLHRAHHGLYRLSRQNPEPLERVAEQIEELHIEEFEQAALLISREPTVRATLEQAGISPRDFYLTQHNLVNAVFVLQARARGRSDHLPAVSERNLEFVRRNAELANRVMAERRPRDP